MGDRGSHWALAGPDSLLLSGPLFPAKTLRTACSHLAALALAMQCSRAQATVAVMSRAMGLPLSLLPPPVCSASLRGLASNQAATGVKHCIRAQQYRAHRETEAHLAHTNIANSAWRGGVCMSPVGGCQGESLPPPLSFQRHLAIRWGTADNAGRTAGLQAQCDRGEEGRRGTDHGPK